MSTATLTAPSSSRGKPARALALPLTGAAGALLLIVVGMLLASRRDEVLPAEYGQVRGGEAGRSVNGTAVLADLFRRRGHSVTTLSRFSPRLNKYDIVVWVPDDFAPPNEEHREYLEDWLKKGTGRTLVYVGRDYNAAIDYWERMAPTASPEQAGESLHRQAEARASWESARSQMPNDEYVRWFTVKRDQKRHKVAQLSGPWADGIDASKTDIHVEGDLSPPTYDEVKMLGDPLPPETIETLLVAGNDTLAFRLTNETKDEDNWHGGQIIVLTNGSFVLNYPLVNHEHRKLADKLIVQCETGKKGGDPKRITFIESEAKGPSILKKEPTGGMPSPLELLKVWPLNAILLHAAVLGIIVCLSQSPIFGRPRELPGDSPSDFGKHVAALGKLLAAAKDRNYAQARLAQYRQLAERRSGRSHLKAKK